jgi:ABC-type amino acid transport system permease subunit
MFHDEDQTQHAPFLHGLLVGLEGVQLPGVLLISPSWMGSSLLMCKGTTLEMLLAHSEMDYGHHHLTQQLLHPIQQRAIITFIYLWFI